MMDSKTAVSLLRKHDTLEGKRKFSQGITSHDVYHSLSQEQAISIADLIEQQAAEIENLQSKLTESERFAELGRLAIKCDVVSCGGFFEEQDCQHDCSDYEYCKLWNKLKGVVNDG